MNRIKGKYKRGIHKTVWDLNYVSNGQISLKEPKGEAPWWRRGYPVVPGKYSVAMSKEYQGKITTLGKVQSFEIQPLRAGALKGMPLAETKSFREDLASIRTDLNAMNDAMGDASKRLNALRRAAYATSGDTRDVLLTIHETDEKMKALSLKLYGDDTPSDIGERTDPSFQSWFFTATNGARGSYGPTKMHKQCLEYAKTAMSDMKTEVKDYSKNIIPNIESELIKLGAPYIEGQGMKD